MDRAELRKRLLAERSTMDVEMLQYLGDQITQKVTGSDWYRDSVVIHCFSGSVAKGEVSTTTLLYHIIESGRKLVMPKMTGIPGVLSHHLVTNPATLKTGKWGIPEPSGGETIRPGQIDLVLVPGLAADLRGNRIGYGMGYYDRFLALTNAKTMMLLPQRMILDYIPECPHDVPVQAVVTEHKVLICNANG